MEEVKSEKILFYLKMKETTLCLDAGGDNLVRNGGMLNRGKNKELLEQYP